MPLDAATDLTHIVANPERVADLPADQVPVLLGALEQLRAALWARMVRALAPVARDLDSPVGEQLLTVPEVAAELRFTRGYVYDAVRRGELSAVRTGKYVRIRRAALTAWLEGRPAITLDGHGVSPDSVRLTRRRPAQPVSRKSQPPPPSRRELTSSGARRVKASVPPAQRTND